MESIYLDHNATAPPTPEVVAAVTAALAEPWGNPSSTHRAGQAARRAVEGARASVAKMLTCDDNELVFTSGGTESVDLALRGSLDPTGKRDVIVTSRQEHNAVRELAEQLQVEGRARVHWLEHEPDGRVSVDRLSAVLASQAASVAVVSVMWVNHETGVVQPVVEIGEACRAAGVRFHSDATQAVGKRLLALSEVPVDLLSFSAHKFHGPMGVGGLFVRRGVRLRSRLVGGPQERSRRAGTENVAGIVGLGVAATQAAHWLGGEGPERLRALRDHFEQQIRRTLGEVEVNGGAATRSVETSNLAFSGVEAEIVLLMLSERGVHASAGAACASGSSDPSPVLLDMGYEPARVAGSIRFSLGRTTTHILIDRAVTIITETIRRLRGSDLGAETKPSVERSS